MPDKSDVYGARKVIVTYIIVPALSA